ncbi:hypothetical protein SAMN05216316_0393 [Nitrosovibrio sp. Nv6]|nr:hypothetical protein SAMN05216316_0393 [Nitrosovibrio sp. Nv6]
MRILKANSYSIGRKSGEIWTSQTLLQPISFKSDRLLEVPYQEKGGILTFFEQQLLDKDRQSKDFGCGSGSETFSDRNEPYLDNFLTIVSQSDVGRQTALSL